MKVISVRGHCENALSPIDSKVSGNSTVLRAEQERNALSSITFAPLILTEVRHLICSHAIYPKTSRDSGISKAVIAVKRNAEIPIKVSVRGRLQACCVLEYANALSSIESNPSGRTTLLTFAHE